MAQWWRQVWAGKRFYAGAIVLALAGLGCASTPPMTADALDDAILALGENVEGSPGSLRFEYAGIPIACFSSATHDRMRLVAPVRRVEELTPDQVGAMLTANYHSALDARYAVSQGVVYAAFLHPLGSLTEAELQSALDQVANLVLTFGTGYSSGALLYGPQGEAL
ncbi:MAG: hypothetical protein AAF430_16175 [Myxococcota bacterium]